jgi:hypothetical protein
MWDNAERQHAIVIGVSVAGLAVARAAAELSADKDL